MSRERLERPRKRLGECGSLDVRKQKLSKTSNRRALRSSRKRSNAMMRMTQKLRPDLKIMPEKASRHSVSDARTLSAFAKTCASALQRLQM